MVIYRRDVVLRAYGYRPAFVHAEEDYDLWLRDEPGDGWKTSPSRWSPTGPRRAGIEPPRITPVAQRRRLAVSHCAVLEGRPTAEGLDSLPADRDIDAGKARPRRAHLRPPPGGRALFYALSQCASPAILADAARNTPAAMAAMASRGGWPGAWLRPSARSCRAAGDRWPWAETPRAPACTHPHAYLR